MSASLRRVLSDIQSFIRAADRLDAQTVELDIRARWHEAQAGYRWALSRDRIKKENARSAASTKTSSTKTNGASRHSAATSPLCGDACSFTGTGMNM